MTDQAGHANRRPHTEVPTERRRHCAAGSHYGGVHRVDVLDVDARLTPLP